MVTLSPPFAGVGKINCRAKAYQPNLLDAKYDAGIVAPVSLKIPAAVHERLKNPAAAGVFEHKLKLNCIRKTGLGELIINGF